MGVQHVCKINDHMFVPLQLRRKVLTACMTDDFSAVA